MLYVSSEKSVVLISIGLAVASSLKAESSFSIIMNSYNKIISLAVYRKMSKEEVAD